MNEKDYIDNIIENYINERKTLNYLHIRKEAQLTPAQYNLLSSIYGHFKMGILFDDKGAKIISMTLELIKYAGKWDSDANAREMVFQIMEKYIAIKNTGRAGQTILPWFSAIREEPFKMENGEYKNSFIFYLNDVFLKYGQDLDIFFYFGSKNIYSKYSISFYNFFSYILKKFKEDGKFPSFRFTISVAKLRDIIGIDQNFRYSRFKQIFNESADDLYLHGGIELEKLDSKHNPEQEIEREGRKVLTLSFNVSYIVKFDQEYANSIFEKREKAKTKRHKKTDTSKTTPKEESK